MPDLFRIRKEPAVNILEMLLPEHLDSSEFDRLNEALLGLFDETESAPKGWVIDFSAVRYIGSAMLGLMVNFRQHVKNHKGKLVLCGVSPRLEEIIRTCCMDRLFLIAKTRQEALRSVQ
jgi:anti-anti-sigma factor